MEKFLGNNFARSNAEDNTSGPSNRGGTAGGITKVVENTISNKPKRSERRVSAKCWTLLFSLAYASFAASRTLLERSLTCLKFILDSEYLFC